MSSPTLTTQNNDALQAGAAVTQMRGAVRFPLRLPVKVRFHGGVVDAMTEDISSTGVQFSSDQAIASGMLVEWEICLPSNVMGSAGDVNVDCTGRVMWTRKHLEAHRFGVVIDSYLLKEKQV